MCTIGAIRLKNGAMALFKNKDFSAKQFSDHVVMDADLFGCEGLETFAASDADMVFSGLSAGANRHGLLATVNHVKITDPDHHNYDQLTELALRQAKTADQAVAIIKQALKHHAYWWGNLIFADHKGCYAMEVRGQDYHVTKLADRVFRTNHQPLFGDTVSPDDLPCSAKRFDAANGRLSDVMTLDHLKEMLSAHDDDGTGICNHGVPLTTVYSYILIHHQNSITAHIAHGLPCQADWVELTPPFGSCWSEQPQKAFLKAYPGVAA